ncbi:MAG TPA: amidohydrolase family protein [Candidatus Polarisedimenticolaceae bacterium]
MPRKVDLHTHVLPKEWPDLEARYGYPGFVRLEHHRAGCARMIVGGSVFREIGDNCWDPVKRLAECDAAGIDLQVLSTVPVMFSYWAKAADGLDLSRLLNDHLAEIVGRWPTRFAGLGTIPLQDPGLAIGELERCVGELGLDGVQIGSNVNGRNLDDPELFPVFERAADLDAAVFVHPWEMLGRDRMSKYWLPWLVGMPAETAVAVCSVIFGGVLERLPSLRIGFAHGGGSFPGTFGRIQHGAEARPDLVPCAPSGYLGRFFVDSLVHDADALRFLIRLVGAERIALGSDYPFPLGEEVPGAMIESMSDLDAETRTRLLSGTAMEFLGR